MHGLYEDGYYHGLIPADDYPNYSLVFKHILDAIFKLYELFKNNKQVMTDLTKSLIHLAINLSSFINSNLQDSLFEIELPVLIKKIFHFLLGTIEKEISHEQDNFGCIKSLLICFEVG